MATCIWPRVSGHVYGRVCVISWVSMLTKYAHKCAYGHLSMVMLCLCMYVRYDGYVCVCTCLSVVDDVYMYGTCVFFMKKERVARDTFVVFAN